MLTDEERLMLEYVQLHSGRLVRTVLKAVNGRRQELFSLANQGLIDVKADRVYPVEEAEKE